MPSGAEGPWRDVVMEPQPQEVVRGLGRRPLSRSPPAPSEQVLHLWLEVLCSSLPTVEKWYQPWSFLRSPGWVQIKCELR